MEFAAANFRLIRIDVTDALYRHNFMAEGTPPGQALARANALGALWLAQHQDVIDACGCPVKPQVVRWAEWYKHPEYSETLIGFERAHSMSAILRDAVHADILEFHRRKYRTPSLSEMEHARNYLIEEMAIICLQARELPSVKIYPGDELSCLNVVRRGLVPEAPAGLEREQYAKIKFERRGRLAAVREAMSLTYGGGVPGS